ncbi:MAG: hypothetical protein HY910_03430 [Desulfarculus sp.]|nr:hypothetical protein [Desulfarculus sp.]
MLRSNSRLCLFCLLGLLLGLAGAPAARAETVSLPITIDYPLLRDMVARQSFPGPGETATVVNQMGGCTLIEMSQPQVEPEREYLRLRSAITVRLGVSVAGKCLNPVDWKGFIELVQRPRLTAPHWDMAFDTVQSRLFDQDGQPAKLAQTMWDLIKEHVHAYLDRQTISLAPPMKDLTQFLPLLMDQASQPRMQAWMKSLRPGPLTVTPLALKADILMDVAPAAAPDAERLTISAPEVERFIDAWQAWDAFLVYQINFLGRRPLTAQERRTLLDTLLETRHRFVAELAQDSPTRRDVVREQFVMAWQRLAPLFRRQLAEGGTDRRLSYLGFFTAADALAALDRLGPTLGVDVSKNGLIRLIRLMEADSARQPGLEYSPAVDPGLRRILGLGPAPEMAGPAYPVQELPWSPPEPQPGETAPSPGRPDDVPSDSPPASSRFLRWLVGTAWAAEGGQPADLKEIRPWVLMPDNREVYLERLKEAIRVASQKTVAKNRLDPRHQEMFSLLATSTAWQESCWRQFITAGGKITYLRSYNNTSVGVMQINERVWRGMYDLPSLRWNVLYNIRAGCEILELYLREYALQGNGKSRSLDPPTLAKAVYAMYNGGPGQLERFLKRQASNSYAMSDKLFAEKLNWVMSGQWDKLERCWGQ